MRKKLLLFMCCVTIGLGGCGSANVTESGSQVESGSSAGDVGEKKVTGIEPEENKEEVKEDAKASKGQGADKEVTDADIITGNPEAGTVTAYDEDGSEVLLTENTDGTYLSGDSITYHLGKDGIYHSEGKPDLYANKLNTSKKESSKAVTEQQALEAIKRYCFENDPDLEETMKSKDNAAYFDVSTNDNGEIVVLYRSYTAAQVRYYINPTSGEVYVTEQVPGIKDDEERTDETFNIKKYLD